MIQMKENSKNVEEFNSLHDKVGWGHYSNAISQKALENTIYSVSIYEDNKIIGYGRIIGDGICFIHIHDVMVDPKHQKQKIGSTIMEKLLEKVEEIKIENPSVRVYLGASRGKEDFYRKFGFIARSETMDLGEGMILKK